MMTHKNRHRGNNPLISYHVRVFVRYCPASGDLYDRVMSGTLCHVRNKLYFATFSTVEQTIARIYASLIVAILTKIMAARDSFESGSEI